MNNTGQPSDLDHVLMLNGKIYRVIGTFNSKEQFLGYNVYRPSSEGERTYHGKNYIKNFLEDEKLPQDVLETYEVLSIKDVALHIDPVQAALNNSPSFQNTIWFMLYEKLKDVFGTETVGIFGSSMFMLHLTPEGTVRKDVDFVINGLNNIPVLRRYLPEIRQALGFQEISVARQLRQYQRYQRIFQNTHNTIHEIIKRRWAGLQLSEEVVSTLRFRDTSIILPFELVQNPTIIQKNVVISGRVVDADMSNLFPRMFTLLTVNCVYPIYIFWWKFSTPVRDDDHITLCGTKILLKGQEVIRLTNFHDHWLAFNSPGSP